MTPRTIPFFMVLLTVWACGGGPAGTPTGDSDHAAPPDWQVVDTATLDPDQQDQLERARAAKEHLGSALMEALTEELEVGGPEGAVDICRDMAPMISAHAAEESGVEIGRTSFRLRNPANRPPTWAEPLVAARVDTVATLEGPAGELGVMMPIRLAEPCLACHGARENLNEGVRQALAESYPEDEAVGFEIGDLRGWFWVEVPPIES
jgi:hypothetical protein